MPALQTRRASRRLILGLAALALVVGTLLSHQLSHNPGSVTAAAHHTVSATADPETAAFVAHVGTAPDQPASPDHSADELAPACVAILGSVLGGVLLIGLLPGVDGLPRPPPLLPQARGQCPTPLNVPGDVLDATGVQRV